MVAPAKNYGKGIGVEKEILFLQLFANTFSNQLFAGFFCMGKNVYRFSLANPTGTKEDLGGYGCGFCIALISTYAVSIIIRIQCSFKSRLTFIESFFIRIAPIRHNQIQFSLPLQEMLLHTEVFPDRSGAFPNM